MTRKVTAGTDRVRAGRGAAPPSPEASSSTGSTRAAPDARVPGDPGIAAVVVSFDAAEHLPRCLESLHPLAAAGHPVIVVDNASRDGSAALVRERFGWARLLVLDRNVGFAAACNRGAAETTREHLLFLNPDAWLDSGCAVRMAAALARDPALGAVAPHLSYPDGRRQFSWEPTPGIAGEAVRRHLRNPLERWAIAHAPLRALYAALGDPGWLTAACLLVRRAAWEAVGGFDQGFFLYFEDADLCLRLRRAGWRLDLVPGAHAWHLKGGSQRTASAELYYRESQFRFYRKHRSAASRRYLLRRQRRRFGRVDDEALRHALLELCDRFEAELAAASES
ncbi:MAG TPA: glycosyltransferase family 2 protein [Thermoanaerobaculia bacterium]|nr:glycosyltransferase family 2 protein [Thermoanaerobaculia bacterium]